jgi:2-hydroxy-3-keto-5-methylthiopentenyl-1-phosphate phosphatase
MPRMAGTNQDVFNGRYEQISPPETAEIWLDFDGTLTDRDVVDSLVRGYCRSDAWRALETDWQAGRIGSRVCLAGQFSLVRIGENELDAFLASVSLDPGAKALLSLLSDRGVRATILSDGIDWFIDRILRAHQLRSPRVMSNTLVRAGDSWRLVCPHSSMACSVAAAHCKCASMEQLEAPDRQRIYIGDGGSDLCAARKAHVRFAKGVLAARLGEEGLGFYPFATLHDVCRVLEAAWTRSKVRAA